eukprot:scaffold46172_cov31-Tisochrysis_lutea.AAC.1
MRSFASRQCHDRLSRIGRALVVGQQRTTRLSSGVCVRLVRAGRALLDLACAVGMRLRATAASTGALGSPAPASLLGGGSFVWLVVTAVTIRLCHHTPLARLRARLC